MDTNTTFSIGKSANEAGDALEVFAYGIVLMPKTNEGFNNVGQTGADDAGYVIDLNKVSATNYDFSPCVSAALNVEGNGTTSGGTASTPGTDGSSTDSDTNGGTQSGGNNGNNVSLTEDSGTYSGSFAMPGTNATLMINTGSSGDGDTN